MEGSFQVFGIGEDLQVQYLLHYIGMEAYDILCDKIEPGNPAKKSYEELVTIMREHYEPAPLEIMENYRFRLTQKEGESIQEFVAALQRLSINCKFGPYLSTALRNQFVFGLQKPQIQSRLLETADLTWAKAVEKASAMEMSMKDAAQLHKSNTTTGTMQVTEELHLVISIIIIVNLKWITKTNLL